MSLGVSQRKKSQTAKQNKNPQTTTTTKHSYLNENGHSKETKIATLWMRMEKFIPICQGYLQGKQGERTVER